MECLESLNADPDPEVRRQAAEALQNRSATPLRPVLRIRSLGPLEVFLGEDVIEERTWRSPRVKYLFAYLAIQPRPVPEERILEEFWPEDALRGIYVGCLALRRTRAVGPSTPVARSRRLCLNRTHA